MERVKSILILCILLACVAPALAADWYEVPASGNYGADPVTGFNYNPSPDPTAVADWFTNIYVPPYGTFEPTPYYESTGETLGGLINDPTVEIRSNMITAGLNINNDLTAGTMRFGDTYWPLQYSYYSTTYSDQYCRMGDGTTPTVNFDVFTMGRNQSEWPSVSMATTAKWNVRGGTLNIGEFHNLSSDTTATSVANRGLSYSAISTEIGWDLSPTQETVNIGDIYLNENMTFFHVNAGKWTITGDVMLEDGAAAGNMLLYLIGNMVTYTADPESNRFELNIKESVLDQLIAAGQVRVRNGSEGSRVNAVYSRAANFEINLADPDNQGTYVTTTFNENLLITAANKNYWLRVVDIDGEAGDMVRVHVVPEPATLAILGLGAVLSFRRKR